MDTNIWTEGYGAEMFGKFNMSQLGMDEAYLNITSNFSQTLYIYTVFRECYECPFTKDGPISNGTAVISTRFPKLWRIMTEDPAVSPVDSASGVLCDFSPDFGEFGVYDLEISHECQLKTLKEPVNIYFPILTVVLIYALVALLAVSFFYVLNVYRRRAERQTTSCDVDQQKCKQKARVRSLDTFRGFTISLMILANFGFGGYAVFDHVTWNGLQLADLVFPWFMWIMGVCIPISSHSIAKRGTAKKTVVLSVLRRSSILFALGMFLNAGKYLDRLRIFGVLQRFGVCYLIVALAFVIFPLNIESDVIEKHPKRWSDIVALKRHWTIAFSLGALHSLLTFFLQAPNCPRGYLGPGGLHENGTHVGCTGGAAGYIDGILGDHIYQYPLIRKIYQGDAFEVEGILGCLTSALQVILGAQAGVTILCYKAHTSRLLRWAAWGAALGLIGGCLCGFSKEDGPIPINKNLWSLSFVFVTSSLAFFLLALCYLLVDVKKYWSGKPFLFAGMNAILMYVGHSLAFDNFPIRWTPSEAGFTTHFLMLFENVWGVAMWILISYLLYRKKFFLTI